MPAAAATIFHDDYISKAIGHRSPFWLLVEPFCPQYLFESRRKNQKQNVRSLNKPTKLLLFAKEDVKIKSRN
jgi:hypothetical protein